MKIITGSIFEIPLDKEQGYILGRLILPDAIKKLGGSGGFNHILEIFKNYSEEPFQGIELKEVELIELMPPLLLAEKPKSRGNRKWRQLGQVSLEEKPMRLPDFYTHEDMLFHRKCLQEVNLIGVVKDVFANNCKPSEYKKVSHLAPWTHYTIEGVLLVITMYWLKANNKNILDFYRLEGNGDPMLDENISTAYRLVKSMPNYFQIPAKLRWIEGELTDW